MDIAKLGELLMQNMNNKTGLYHKENIYLKKKEKGRTAETKVIKKHESAMKEALEISK